MSMRDQYRTKAAEFQARALCTSDQTARHHFTTMAEYYLQLAALEAQIDCLREFIQEPQLSGRNFFLASVESKSLTGCHMPFQNGQYADTLPAGTGRGSA